MNELVREFIQWVAQIHNVNLIVKPSDKDTFYEYFPELKEVSESETDNPRSEGSPDESR